MTNKELLRAIIAEIDLIMHDKDYRFPESENTWYSRESCKVLTPEEVFEELRTELLQLNNESNKEIAELKRQLEEKTKTIQGLVEAQKHLEESCSYQMFLDIQKQLEEKEKIIEHWHNLYKKRDQQFQSVRQRYHLLNKLQSNYNKKDKLHLLEMQCLELVKENEELHSQPVEIVEKIKNFCDIKHFYPEFVEKKYQEYVVAYTQLIEFLHTILKEYQK